MKFTAKQYAEALFESLEDTDPKHIDIILDNFVAAMSENNDLRMFDDIASEFHKLELAKKGIKEVDVTSAKPLNKENEEQILDELNKLAKGHYELKKKVDEQLVGGVVIKFDDKMIDASVKNNLEQLKNELNK
ncbi:MAG: ATP synthase F1 subunit delta [Candidatus Doudnabacteria bacterium]